MTKNALSIYTNALRRIQTADPVNDFSKASKVISSLSELRKPSPERFANIGLPYKTTMFEYALYTDQTMNSFRNFYFFRDNKELIVNVHKAYDDLYDRVIEQADAEVNGIIYDYAQKKGVGRTQKTLMKDIRSQLLPYNSFTTLTEEDMFKLYRSLRNKKDTITSLDIPNVAPWRSANKIRAYGNKNGWSVSRINSEIGSKQGMKFDKKEAKSYYLHAVAPRHSFVIDYLFSGGGLIYLMAINVNTRKLYAILSGTDGKKTYKTGNKDITASIDAMEKLISMTKVRNIIHDLEGAFGSDEFKEWCFIHDIAQHPYSKYPIPKEMIKGQMSKTRANHSTVALVDRVIRTIRDMNYNMFGYGYFVPSGSGGAYQDKISPNVMDFLVNEYNSSPHRTLSMILGHAYTPNDVDNDTRLEERVVRELLRQNILTYNSLGYKLRPGQKVWLKNDTDNLEKKRSPWMQHPYMVNGHDKGLVSLTDKDGNDIKVSRWMLKDFYRQ